MLEKTSVLLVFAWKTGDLGTVLAPFWRMSCLYGR